MNAEERFWSKIAKAGPDECWEWKAFRNWDGYGMMYFHGRDHRANRIAWMITFGDIPKGMNVCHKCDNPPCCNPNHLFLGTQLDNMSDCAKKGRNVAKLSESEVAEIKREYFSGRSSQVELARKYSVRGNIIFEIVTGKTWSWVEKDLVNTRHVPRKRITPKQIEQIKSMIPLEGLTSREIANKCGVSEATISLIRSGKRRLSL